MKLRIYSTIRQAVAGAWRTAGQGFRAMLHDPQITIYAYLAVIFIYITSPLVTHLVTGAWHHLDHPQVVSNVDQKTPHVLLSHIGLVAFPVFYTFFITAYFTCAISASVLAKLHGRRTTLFYGLRVVWRQFGRVTWFALLSGFFFPMAIIAQRRKLPRGIVGVLMSSFSMSMSQLAPAVVAKDEGIFDTVCHSIEILGKAAKESFVIRVGTIASVFLLGALGFLPKLIQHYWFSGDTARFIGWLITVLLGVGLFVAAKVLSTVMTTTLYYKASGKKI